METSKMFETAVRNKFRFPYRGQVSVEDLWDLSVEDLDKVFKALNAQRKKDQEESLLEVPAPQDEVLETQIEIVRYIVKVKQDETAERAAKSQRDKERADKRQTILRLLADKQDDTLRSMSADELKAMLKDLED